LKYLLDTTWIVGYLRGNQDIIDKIQIFQNEGLAVSVISVAELYEGVFHSQNSASNEVALNLFLQGVRVLDITEQSCISYGQQRAKLYSEGKIIGAIDVLIAATALNHNLTLLTADHDFERIEGLRLMFPDDFS